ncbi:hypothetical protein H6P81_009911 [Aristolochia fimbriata]|uniref:Uncharacterized protein n=1 Tax=Aristolochia fimbriata TaxID=158543 RepID=A0AAV7END2_ARIFI|nr:hypothetical protein H6P81_009911 [Aristolochia fimbriata]
MATMCPMLKFIRVFGHKGFPLTQESVRAQWTIQNRRKNDDLPRASILNFDSGAATEKSVGKLNLYRQGGKWFHDSLAESSPREYRQSRAPTRAPIPTYTWSLVQSGHPMFDKIKTASAKD